MSAVLEPLPDESVPVPRRRGVPSSEEELLVFARRFNAEIRRHDVTIARLSKASSVSVRHIRQLQDGSSRPTLGTALKLAKALAIPAGRLFKEDRRLRPEKRGVNLT